MRARELTGLMLAFGRHRPHRTTSCDLGQAVRETEPLLRRALGDDVELHVVIADEGERVRLARAELERILVNLVVNCREAMPEGGRVDLTTRVVAEPERCVVELCVRDTGQGMSETVRRQAFDPFFTTKERGSGLGLASVYGLVQRGRGEIDVSTGPDVGTEVRIRLPIVEEGPAVAEDAAG